VQLGFFFWPYDPEYTRRLASLGDALGFAMVGIADTPGNAMDAWVATTVAAQNIRRARVALCVTNVTTRHPAITATAAASVDLLAPDRVVLGVGSGHSGVVNVGSTATRPESLGTAVTFMRRLLRGEPATWDDGERAGASPASSIPWLRGRVPVYVAASGPKAMHVAGAVSDGVFVNYGLQKEHVAHVDVTVGAGARGAGRAPAEIETWYIACLDCAPKREAAFEKLGNILGFVAAYILGPDPEGRGVPPDLVPAVRELRRVYTTHQRQMEAALVKRLGLFDYLRGRLAVAGTPDDCVEQVKAAAAAGVERLMFTVSLAADPVQAVELFGRHVLPQVTTS
jgi:alkanesulfonate monooxygenase SsuD/methylene tetrahydromethanopterin reductase-like flavin-dependent oxidoreductase (luciferase family)